MRAIAVVSVLLYHLRDDLLCGGFVGVDVFFTISGYLITTIIYNELLNDDFSFLRFYQRRVSRIFPVFFLVTLAILGAASVIYTQQDFASAGALATASVLSVANLKLMLQGNYFQMSPDAQPFLHYWSLSVEEQFYLFWPLALFCAYKLRLTRFRLGILLGVVVAASFAACILLTRSNPTWAFYLLPTRAWELLAGSLLAVEALRLRHDPDRKPSDVAGVAGLTLIILSILFIREEVGFPGYVAALPVAGTLLLIGRRCHPGQLTERLLSRPALTSIGKASYSLYLWHWPVYCFTDYALFTKSDLIRTPLKIGLTAGLSLASYLWFEKPVRLFLNRPARRAVGFAGLAVCICAFVWMGVSIRSSNYVDSSLATVGDGGIVFNPSVQRPVIILMGDSNASMYGKVTQEIAEANQVRAHVISLAAGDPFPGAELYRKSLQFITREKPDVTVFVAAWDEKIGNNHEKLLTALSEILKYSRHVILVTQPPLPPENASREAIRRGGLQPIFEEASVSASRKATNLFLRSLRSDRIHVIDIEPLFVQGDGQIRFVDSHGAQVYQDKGHLSGLGARMVGEQLSSEVAKLVLPAATETLSSSEP